MVARASFDSFSSSSMSTHPMKPLMAQTNDIEELGIPPAMVQDMFYRLLLQEREVSVARFSDVLRVTARMSDLLLAKMKQDNLVEVARTGGLNSLSYVYRLTEAGEKKARDASERSQYIGPLPIDTEVYSESVNIQSQTVGKITPDRVQKALEHLILPPNFDRRIGAALNAGSSLFLYGPPGNGKTTVAEICADLLAGTEPIFIPYTITTGGQIIKVFDPLKHEEVEPDEEWIAQFGRRDMRWAIIKRPAIMVGGELEMANLELRYEPIAKFTKHHYK